MNKFKFVLSNSNHLLDILMILFIMRCEIILSLLPSDKSISFIKCGRPKKKQLPERCTSRDVVKVEWLI